MLAQVLEGDAVQHLGQHVRKVLTRVNLLHPDRVVELTLADDHLATADRCAVSAWTTRGSATR